MQKIIFFLSLVPFIGLSQQKSVKEYYEKINKAELNIIKENYALSLSLYGQAFKLHDPFGIDILNAAIVAAKINNDNEVKNDFNRLQSKGFDVNSLKQNPVFTNYFKKNYIAVKATISNKINVIYRNRLLEMVEADQKFLKSKESRKIYKDTINKIFQNNARELVFLIQKYGFPSEEKVGIGVNNISNIVFAIIVHQSAGEKQVINFSGYLKHAILSGNFDNRQGSYLIEASEGRLNLLYNPLSLMRASYDTFILIKDPNGLTRKKGTTFYTKWGFDKLTDSAILKFDMARNQLYLDSVSESFKKSVFNISNMEFALGNDDSGITYQRTKYAEFLHMQNSMSYLY